MPIRKRKYSKRRNLKNRNPKKRTQRRSTKYNLRGGRCGKNKNGVQTCNTYSDCYGEEDIPGKFKSCKGILSAIGISGCQGVCGYEKKRARRRSCTRSEQCSQGLRCGTCYKNPGSMSTSTYEGCKYEGSTSRKC